MIPDSISVCNHSVHNINPRISSSSLGSYGILLAESNFLVDLLQMSEGKVVEDPQKIVAQLRDTKMFPDELFSPGKVRSFLWSLDVSHIFMHSGSDRDDKTII